MPRHVLIIPLFAALLFLAVFIGCSKSSSSSGGDRKTLIVQASWKYDTAGFDLHKHGVIDIGDTSIKACVRDNTYTFKKDSTGVMDEGASKCNPADPQTVPFTWKLTHHDSVLNISGNLLLSGSINILSMNATKFAIYKDTIYLGQSFRYLIFLKH